MATIPFSDVIDYTHLPIDSQDVVTKVHLVIAGRTVGSRDPWYRAVNREEDPDADPESGGDVIEELSPMEEPLVYIYESPEHATFGCARAFELPVGTNPFLEAGDASLPEPVGSNVTDVENVVDGSEETFAVVTDTGSVATIAFPWDASTWGWAVMYGGAQYDGSQYEGLVVSWDDNRVLAVGDESIRGYGSWRLPAGATHQHAVVLSDARGHPLNGGSTDRLAWLRLQVNAGTVGAPAPETLVRITHFYPLILNESLLEDIAKQQIRLPASSPRRVTVRSADWLTELATDREHTITGWPGGDFTGRVAQVQFELGRCVIDFEQAGAPTGMGFESVEAERARALRTDGTIRQANYRQLVGGRL